MPDTYVHDPDAVLDYAWDWTAWLADGETISSYEVSGAGVTVDSDDEDAGVVTVWVSGGTDGDNATVTFHIETTQSRIEDRTVTLLVRQR